MDIESYRLWLENERKKKSELIKDNEELRGCELRVLGLGDYAVSEMKGDDRRRAESRWRNMVCLSKRRLRDQASRRVGKIWKTDYYIEVKRQRIYLFSNQPKITASAKRPHYEEQISFGAPQSDLFLRFLFLERFQDVNLVEELISFLPFEIDNVYCIVQSPWRNSSYYIIGLEGERFFFVSQMEVESKIKDSNDPNWKALRKMVSKLLKKRKKMEVYSSSF